MLLTLCKAAGVINRMRNRRCYQHNAKPYVLLTLQSCAVKLLVELMYLVFTRMPGELPQAIHAGEEIWATYTRTQKKLNVDRLSKTLSFGKWSIYVVEAGDKMSFNSRFSNQCGKQGITSNPLAISKQSLNERM